MGWQVRGGSCHEIFWTHANSSKQQTNTKIRQAIKISKKNSSKTLKNTSVNKKPKLSLKEKRKHKREKTKKTN